MENLRIYKKALELIALVYKLCRDNQQLNRDYSLNDQIKNQLYL